MSYLRSVRFPEEVKAPMQEEAARRGVSVNKMIAEVVTQALGESPGSTAKTQVLAAGEQRKPKPARKAKASSDGDSNSPSPAKTRKPVVKPVIDCRHGIPDCRICKTGRWAE